jgi:hypothetical protein
MAGAHRSAMPRNDISDSLSVRHEDDPRKPVEALQQETEQELISAERRQTGGVEHQSAADLEGVPAARREEEGIAGDAERATRQQRAADADQQVPRGEPSTGGGGNMTRGPTRR